MKSRFNINELLYYFNPKTLSGMIGLSHATKVGNLKVLYTLRGDGFVV